MRSRHAICGIRVVQDARNSVREASRLLGVAVVDGVAGAVAYPIERPRTRAVRGRPGRTVDARVIRRAVLVDASVRRFDRERCGTIRRGSGNRAYARERLDFGAVLRVRRSVDGAVHDDQPLAVEAEAVAGVPSRCGGDTVLRDGARAARDLRQAADGPADAEQAAARAMAVVERERPESCRWCRAAVQSGSCTALRRLRETEAKPGVRPTPALAIVATWRAGGSGEGRAETAHKAGSSIAIVSLRPASFRPPTRYPGLPATARPLSGPNP